MFKQASLVTPMVQSLPFLERTSSLPCICYNKKGYGKIKGWNLKEAGLVRGAHCLFENGL
eukprot:c15307_g1_i1 orf=20-199(-)